ncbi:MAG: hypothetical protein MRJ96_10075 [Nitrospirales bacterium]|nr:hypothetical protein [Nitrospira sp.]MDR4501784.1 hypothetical protein [Nitrospirales bacterium]
MCNSLTKTIGFGFSILLSFLIVSGCQLWPFMSEEDGRKPRDLGKADQVWDPYAPPPTTLSEGYGESFRTARDLQILHPEASEKLDPVEGLDGPASNQAIQRYRKHFQKPPYEMKTKGSGGGKK